MSNCTLSDMQSIIKAKEYSPTFNVKIINKSSNPLPKYATDGSAAFDLQANITELLHRYNEQPENIKMLVPSGVIVIGTGLYVEIPNGFQLIITSRSGMAAKQGIHVLNSPGILDSDYRGELLVILRNSGNRIEKITHGDRIAQAQLLPVYRINWVNSEILSETERNQGGLGSTGK